jgi:hypothetical protein
MALASLREMASDDGPSWERELRACEEEVCCRDEQLQLMVDDMPSREEFLAAWELHVEEELGSIPKRERNLHDWSCQLRDREGQLRD